MKIRTLLAVVLAVAIMPITFFMVSFAQTAGENTEGTSADAVTLPAANTTGSPVVTPVSDGNIYEQQVFINWSSSKWVVKGDNLTLNLYKKVVNSLDGVDNDKPSGGELIKTVTIPSNTPMYSFSGLEKQNPDGTFNYYYALVDDETSAKNDVIYTRLGSSTSIFIYEYSLKTPVSNREIQGYIDIKWVDDNDRDNLRPNALEYEVYKINEDKSETLVQKNMIEPNENGSWYKKLDSDLEIYDKNSNKNNYIVKTNIAGYEYTSETISEDQVIKFRLVATHEPEQMSVIGKVMWDTTKNIESMIPDEVTVNLYANGAKIDEFVANKNNDYNYNFNGLFRYKDRVKGQEASPIKYTVSMNPVYKFTTEVVENSIMNNIMETSITNTAVAPDHVNVTVHSSWVDGDNIDGIRPETFKIRLLADGVDTGKVVDLHALDNAYDTFGNLKILNDKGEKIKYSVEAIDKYPYYETSIISMEEYEVKVNDRDETAINTIVHFLNKHEVFKKVTFMDGETKKGIVSVIGGFSINSDSLEAEKMLDNPKESNKKFIEWNTKADGSGDTFTGDTIVNEDMTVYAIYESSSSNIPSKPTNPKSPKTGDDSNVFIYEAVLLLSAAALYKLKYKTK